MFVIGTAGHVDHGKSALIEALTGTHPDRLREEQERGLTIELGFAWLTLPSGREVSIVDVPGHVRFVRHMLAGVGAIDLALFVVAADEGVMPQTREHLEILDLLEIGRGLVALTKCDLVDDGDWLDLVEEEVRGLMEPTTLAASPIVRVSAVSGSGLDELQTTIDAALEGLPAPRDIGRPRLGIDRVFTMSGFGTVVTGTLLDGRLRTGDSLDAVPGGPRARIRGLQTHRREQEEAEPGTRVAVNLAGIATHDLQRGQVLAPPGSIEAVRTFDARVRVLAHRALRHNLRVALHTGSAEVQARVRVLGGDRIEAGQSGWCQLVLTEPVAALAGDLFVLRVSDETLAGGRVIEVNAPRHRRSDRAVIARLKSLATGTPESRVLSALERIEPATLAELGSAVELSEAALASAVRTLAERGEVTVLRASGDASDGTSDRTSDDPADGALYVAAAGLNRIALQTQRALERYHDEWLLRFAMPREELRSRLDRSRLDFAALLPSLPGIVESEHGVALAGWSPRPTAAQQRQAGEAVAALQPGGAAPPRLDIDGELLGYLAAAGLVVDCGDGIVLAAEAFEAARETVVATLRASGSATLAELRDALGTNRRAAQAILETMDRRHVTRREGDGRVLFGG